MDNVQMESFHFIGLPIRTTNENGQAATDIPALWQKVMSEGWLDKISNKLDHDVICIYTDYESDHNKPYTAIVGCRVSSLDSVPEQMRGLTIGGSTYVPFKAKGNLNEGAVVQAWMRVWQSNIPRAYTVDLEVYGEKSSDPSNAEVDIFIAIP